MHFALIPSKNITGVISDYNITFDELHVFSTNVGLKKVADTFIDEHKAVAYCGSSGDGFVFSHSLDAVESLLKILT